MAYHCLKTSLSEESYRSLRTSLQYSSVDQELRTIIITSAVPGEGKSTVASNLASSISETKRKVLLLDADLRKPSIHKKMNLSNQLGLTDAIVQKLELTKVIQQVNECFHVMTAGKMPPNPAEIVGSEAMGQLLNHLREVYDYIIIDTPPVLSVTDSKLLSLKADGTLLVIREGVSKNKLILEAYKELEKIQVNVVGTVLNDCEEKTKGYSKYYYQYEKETKYKGCKKRHK